jgi:hypothetical protein
MHTDFQSPDLAIQNPRTLNFQFCPVSGEFTGQRLDTIDPRFKDYKLEDLDFRNDPHLLSKAKKNTKGKELVEKTFEFKKVEEELRSLEEKVEINQQTGFAGISG